MSDASVLVLVVAAVAAIAMFVLLRSTREELQRSETARLAEAASRETRARTLLGSWQQSELASIREQAREAAVRDAQFQLGVWKEAEEKRIRGDATKRSQSVITGRVAEHFVPYLPEFRYNPKDAKYLGQPVDFVVFDGLDEGALREIVFVEVKTGSSALTPREKQLRGVVQSRKVGWREIRLAGSMSSIEEEPIAAATNDGCSIVVPSFGDNPSQKAVLIRWAVADGARVMRDQPLCEIETDQFVIEMPSPCDGLLSQTAAEGSTLPVGGVLGLILPTS